MPQVIENTRSEYIRDETVPADAVVAKNSTGLLIARVIAFITSVILAILAIRFVFVLLGANPSNGFAHFIFSVSHPFVAPFFTLFNYQYLGGASRFELYTLVAMAIYALVGYGLARLLTLNRPPRAARY